MGKAARLRREENGQNEDCDSKEVEMTNASKNVMNENENNFGTWTEASIPNSDNQQSNCQNEQISFSFSMKPRKRKRGHCLFLNAENDDEYGDVAMDGDDDEDNVDCNGKDQSLDTIFSQNTQGGTMSSSSMSSIPGSNDNGDDGVEALMICTNEMESIEKQKSLVPAPPPLPYSLRD